MREFRGDFLLAQDILRRQRIGFQELIVRSVEHHLASEISCARPYFHDPVGGLDEFLVMLDDDDGVAHLPQFLDRRDRSCDLSLVESYGRLVEDVDDSCQFISQLFR